QSVVGDAFSATFSYDFPVGSTPVSCDVTDGNGNTATVTFDVEVFDVTDPVFTFVPPAITVEAAGPSGTSLTLDTATATDAFAVTIANDAPAVFPLGETTVTWTATDANGRTATATTVVTVEDNTPPLFTFVPPNVSADASGPSGTSVTLGTATATDAFGVTITDDAPALFPLGATTVTWTATDTNGNVATATTEVTISDNTPPVFTFVPPAISFDAAGPAGTAVPLDTATATDAFGVTITSDAPALFPLGTTTVTWTATDANGNTATATTVVTVVDNAPPIFTFVPPAQSFEAAGPAGTAVTLPEATAADAFGVIITSDAPALFPLGTTTVTWTATDANGNVAMATTEVSISDNTPPVFTFVPPDQTVEAAGSSGTAVTLAAATATDAFGVTITSDAPALFPLGATTVTWTATDANSNVVTATTVVTVIDGAGPVITAPDVVLSVDYVNPMDPDWGSVPESVYAANVTATDTFDGAITDISCIRDIANTDPLLGDTDFEFSDTPYSITCTAEDSSGNDGTASFLLTVSYLFDINLELPKKRARAGSTIPIDFDYSEWSGGAPVDSSTIPVRVSWAKMTDSSCTTQDTSIPEESSGLGEDSGNSDFRYSNSSDTWQFSWQTPSLGGYYRLAISPPGKFVDNAVACVRLR
ncbi:MAG: HYR domain-containing protein, partial [Woeseiaceae bacterium]